MFRDVEAKMLYTGSKEGLAISIPFLASILRPTRLRRKCPDLTF